jgi:hydroxymethylpyrimidine/phosphomethylpyrimidine kinase
LLNTYFSFSEVPIIVNNLSSFKPNIVTIAGSDPLSKSGIMADFKAGYDLDANIFNVISAINAQNNQKISNILYLDQKIIHDQLEAIFSENKIDIVKIGMVGNSDAVNEIIDFFTKKNIKKIYTEYKIIFDPVIKASNGFDLITDEAIQKIESELFPLCYLITPNIYELEILSGIKIINLEDIKKAVQKLKNLGAKNILVKGGHFQEKSDKVLSFLFLDNRIIKIRNKRLEKNLRGTGCMLSTAIAVFLGKNFDLVQSIRRANRYVYHKIKSG